MQKQDNEQQLSSPARRMVPVPQSAYGPPHPALNESQDPASLACGRVLKRDGRYEEASIGKIEARLKRLSPGLHVNCIKLARQVIDGLSDGIKTSQIDELAAEFAHERISDHPDWDVLAARIAVSNHQKETLPLFSQVMEALYKAKQLRDDFIEFVREHADELDQAIDYDRDNLFTYFGFKTFMHSYGLRISEFDAERGRETTKVYERPQHMWMRVAVALHLNDVEAAIETYDWMSCQYFTHASPTLFNSGTKNQQLSSCFLIAMKDDSIEGIYDTLKEVAMISKSSGGIGLHCSNIRAEGTLIASAGRPSSGIIPMLQPFHATARYVDQGRKRKGAIACYLELWHADIMDFLLVKENTGESKEWQESGKARMRDLHLALWVSDLFMKRVDQFGDWSLMCPKLCGDLQELYGEEFGRRYEEYERMGHPYVRRTVKAQDVWQRIIDAQIHTGEPYMVYKDAVNRKTNHQNLGTVKSSNLCSEIVQYSSAEKTAVCNLASVSLKSFVVVEDEVPRYDFETLAYVVKIITRNLDRIIDVNRYPTPETKRSNMSERPMGIGVQGLADAFIKMRYPYTSQEAYQLNKDIFETIYYAALDASCELAQEAGAAYPSYNENGGCPVSHGNLQFDMWREEGHDVELSGRWDWDALRARIAKYGVRNSLLVALMPTASTSQLLGNNESFEPFTNNMYERIVLSGTYKVVNRQMVLDLIEEGLWDEQMKNKIIALGGSIQNIPEIPQHLKDLYLTSYDMSQKHIIDQAADRGPFVDQSMSLNIHLGNPSFAAVSSMHMYGWQRGLKTGQYYLRTAAAVDPIKVTIDPELERQALAGAEEESPTPEEAEGTEGWVCNMEEGCISCSG